MSLYEPLHRSASVGTWPNPAIVQQAVAQLPWGHNLVFYLVVELKGRKFRPEPLGQPSFYLTAVDRQVKSEHDNPTIGLLLYKSKNKIVVKYALGDKS